MNIFKSPRGSPFDKDVELATSEKDDIENWAEIMKVCDKAVNYEDGIKFCLQSIIKRMQNSNQKVILHTLTLLDACVKNCGESFHQGMASEQFIAVIKKLMNNGTPPVVDKMKQLLKIWAEGSFKEDPKLCIIPSFYYKLKSEGMEFPPSPKDPSKDLQEAIQKESDDFAKAIEMSLKDTRFVLQCDQANLTKNSGELFKVQAVYDFESAEPDELSFKIGEIILVLDSSDPNWWMGSSQLGDGLFPRAFVTELNTEQVESAELKTDQSSQANTVPGSLLLKERDETKDSDKPLAVEIDEAKINYTLYMLDLADPTGEVPDPNELKDMEDECHAMAPLVDEKLQKIDSSLAALMSINKEITNALNMYFEVSKKPEALIQSNSTNQSFYNPGQVNVPYQISSMQSPTVLLQQNKNQKPNFPLQSSQFAQLIPSKEDGILQSFATGHFIADNSVPPLGTNWNSAICSTQSIDYTDRNSNINSTVLQVSDGIESSDSANSKLQTAPNYSIGTSAASPLTNVQYAPLHNFNIEHPNASMYTNFPYREMPTSRQSSQFQSTVINSAPHALLNSLQGTSVPINSMPFQSMPNNTVPLNSWSLQNSNTCKMPAVSYGLDSASQVSCVPYTPISAALPVPTNTFENVAQAYNDSNQFQKNKFSPQYDAVLSDLTQQQNTPASISTVTSHMGSALYQTQSVSCTADSGAALTSHNSYSVASNYNALLLNPALVPNISEPSGLDSSSDQTKCDSYTSVTELKVPSNALENSALPCHNLDVQPLQRKELSSNNTISESLHAINTPVSVENSTSTSSSVYRRNDIDSKVTTVQTVPDTSCIAIDSDILSSPVNHSIPPLQPKKS